MPMEPRKSAASRASSSVSAAVPAEFSLGGGRSRSTRLRLRPRAWCDHNRNASSPVPRTARVDNVTDRRLIVRSRVSVSLAAGSVARAGVRPDPLDDSIHSDRR